jgi:hypothetical protein
MVTALLKLQYCGKGKGYHDVPIREHRGDGVVATTHINPALEERG